LQPTLPDGATELCTLDSTTYASLPDGSNLAAEQPVPVETVTLTDTLRAALKAASPHVRLINQRIVERIRERYTPDDEIKCLRLAPSAETEAWNEWCEACRDWGRAQKAALGL
jgi:hypothetical protein